MSKLGSCAGIFNDYLDADAGSDGADGPLINRPLHLQREIVQACRKVLPRFSVQAEACTNFLKFWDFPKFGNQIPVFGNEIMDLIQGNWPAWLGLEKRSF